MHHKGIHHITAVAGDPKRNHDFYTEKLGLRMVKKTVNFDDPSVYHLYYGDETGRPGSTLTFFPWSHLQNGKPDRGQVVAIGFSVPHDSLDFWQEHLTQAGINITEPFTRFGKQIIGFQDPDGLHLELLTDPGVSDIEGWSGGPVPGEHAIRGFHGATLAEENYKPTVQLLTEFLGFREIDEEMDRHLLKTDAPFGSIIEIIDGSELDGRPGKGTVHHIAFRAEDSDEQDQMRKDLLEAGYFATGAKDRQYFRSVYFHEPGGVLFEIATDPPGFTIDEEIGQLGEKLRLPEWLEPKRDLIEADLASLK